MVVLRRYVELPLPGLSHSSLLVATVCKEEEDGQRRSMEERSNALLDRGTGGWAVDRGSFNRDR